MIGLKKVSGGAGEWNTGAESSISEIASNNLNCVTVQQSSSTPLVLETFHVLTGGVAAESVALSAGCVIPPGAEPQVPIANGIIQIATTFAPCDLGSSITLIDSNCVSLGTDPNAANEGTASIDFNITKRADGNIEWSIEIEASTYSPTSEEATVTAYLNAGFAPISAYGDTILDLVANTITFSAYAGSPQTFPLTKSTSTGYGGSGTQISTTWIGGGILLDPTDSLNPNSGYPLAANIMVETSEGEIIAGSGEYKDRVRYLSVPATADFTCLYGSGGSTSFGDGDGVIEDIQKNGSAITWGTMPVPFTLTGTTITAESQGVAQGYGATAIETFKTGDIITGTIPYGAGINDNYHEIGLLLKHQPIAGMFPVGNDKWGEYAVMRSTLPGGFNGYKFKSPPSDLSSLSPLQTRQVEMRLTTSGIEMYIDGSLYKTSTITKTVTVNNPCATVSNGTNASLTTNTLIDFSACSAGTYEITVRYSDGAVSTGCVVVAGTPVTPTTPDSDISYVVTVSELSDPVVELDIVTGNAIVQLNPAGITDCTQRHVWLTRSCNNPELSMTLVSCAGNIGCNSSITFEPGESHLFVWNGINWIVLV